MSLSRVELLVDRDGRHVDAVLPLVVALRTWADPHAPDRTLGVPAARLAVSPTAAHLDAALDDRAVPVAVVVEDLDSLSERVRTRARVIVTRTSHPSPAADDVLVLPADIIDTAAHPPLAPFVRARWRERLGLPASLVVRVGYHDPFPGDDASVAAALSVCSAAAVRGPWLLTALALGTAVVTDASDAQRLGTRDGIEVVVDAPVNAAARAEALGTDWPQAAALGHAARRFVEEHRSWSGRARALLDRLGIARPTLPGAPLAGLQGRLDALDTPSAGPVALRALRRTGQITGSADLLMLTGRRR